MEICNKLKNCFKERCDFSDIVLLITFLLIGGFNEYVSCLVTIALTVYLFIKIRKNKGLYINLSLMSVSLATVIAFYGLTALWAIDSGMALIGFLKFLPVLLYAAALWQAKGKESLLGILPYFAAVLVAISSLGTLIEPIKDWFLVAERFAGFFQYPNTFALFLLVCELLLLKKSPLKIVDYITLLILIGGLLYTGSRTVFLLFIASNFLMPFLSASKKIKISVSVLAVVALIVVLAVALFGPEGNVFSRYLKIGLTESTFIGRLLYFTDALPLLLKYPFGMGYLGYHFVQGSIQTGVYNVAYVHNDFLQIALDVGIIPAILFLTAIVSFFFKRQVPVQSKVVAGTVVLHSMFDFNLQFIGMFMLLILLMNTDGKKQIFIEKITAVKIALPIVLIINLYMGIALGLAHFGVREAANAMYPYNTRNSLNMLNKEENLDRANELADKILKQNTYYYAPFSVKAKYSYSEGNFAGVIENKNAVFERIPFRYTEYKEYCIMLINGITAYENMGDTGSAQICKNELISVKNQIEGNADRLSKFGKMIDEQPVTTLPSDVLVYIDNLDEGQVGQN